MNRPPWWLLAIVMVALVVAGWRAMHDDAKPSWCFKGFCGYGICPPCPGDPPEGTLAPILVRDSATPSEVPPCPSP